MIEFALPSVTVKPSNLSAVLYSRELVAALARQLVASQVEAHLDMMADYPSEYKSYGDINACIQGAKDGTVDYINDMLVEFKDELLAAIDNVKIETTAVKISSEGIVDADVNVTSII